MKKLVAAAIAALFLTPGASAFARDENPYFESNSEGAPVSTLVGSWTSSSDERGVELGLVGGHGVGDRTWFKAGWLTPWTTRGEPASFESMSEFRSLNTLGDTIRFFVKMRWRDKGKPWGPWRRFPMDLEMEGGSWGGMGFGSFFGSGPHGRSMRFEWHIRGVMTGTAELDGTISLAVN